MEANNATYDLAPEVEIKWEAALDEMDRMRNQGDYVNALKMARAAWEFLPEPKLNCSYAYITAMPMLKAFILAKAFDEGIVFSDFLITNTPRKNEVPVFLVQKGILKYESGDLDGAYLEFKRSWDAAGKFGFVEESEKYLAHLTARP